MRGAAADALGRRGTAVAADWVTLGVADWVTLGVADWVTGYCQLEDFMAD